jgi:arylsulfatase A-like enzyme
MTIRIGAADQAAARSRWAAVIATVSVSSPPQRRARFLNRTRRCVRLADSLPDAAPRADAGGAARADHDDACASSRARERRTPTPHALCSVILVAGALTCGRAMVADAEAAQPPPGATRQLVAPQVDLRPVIVGQHELTTPEATPLTITLEDLIVRDRDSIYPDDFTLTLGQGEDYTISAPGEITPFAGFTGSLSVSVRVNDGSHNSPVFQLLVGVIPATVAPNIVVLMLDDLDTRSLDDLLNAGLMPNLQSQVIDRGIAFDEAYVSTPLCCPSRATFFKGQYPHNTGIVTNKLLVPGAGLQMAVSRFDDSVTIATRLQSLGYTTGHVGKYLNGYGSDANLADIAPAFDPHYVPPGWSHWRALVDDSTYCMYNYRINADGSLSRYQRPPGQTEDSATYQTNVLAGFAESFVLEHRDDVAPFYLEVMPVAPHAETCDDAYGGPAPHQDTFDVRIRPDPVDKNVPLPEFVPGPAYDEDLADKPSWISATPSLTAEDLASIGEQYQHRLRAMLSVDRMLGRIVAALGPRLDDTVIVVVSDNGWFYGEHRASGKIYAYTESARVPLYIVAPDVQPGRQSRFALNNDLAPTLLDLASPGYGDAVFDGRSLVPIMRGEEPPAWAERAQFLIEYSRSDSSAYKHPTYRALRSKAQLYIESYGGVYFSPTPPPLIGLELYDLAADPKEMTSLLHYPENGRDPVLAPRLDLLSGCAGASCRQYENALREP